LEKQKKEKARGKAGGPFPAKRLTALAGGSPVGAGVKNVGGIVRQRPRVKKHVRKTGTRGPGPSEVLEGERGGEKLGNAAKFRNSERTGRREPRKKERGERKKVRTFSMLMKGEKGSGEKG